MTDSSLADFQVFGAESRAPRVLIVDEEQTLTKVVELALRLEGWEVAVAGSGSDALAAAENFAPDAILLDIMLPDISGITVASTLRERGDLTPIIFVTGRSSLDDKLAAFAAGGDDYLTKPFALEDAVSHLTSIFRRLGLLASSLVVGDIVLDQETGGAWRSGEPLILDPIEFEVLRILLAAAKPMDLLDIGTQLQLAGISESEATVARVLQRLQRKVDGDEPAVVQFTESGHWQANVGR